MFGNGGLVVLVLELLVFCGLLFVKVLEFEVLLFWGLFIFEVFDVLFAVLGVLVVYDCCWAVLAIKCTVIPDYLTYYVTLLSSISCFPPKTILCLSKGILIFSRIIFLRSETLVV